MDTTSYLLVWTKAAAGPTVTSEPLTKDEALRQFDGLRSIKQAACQGRGRLRVMRAEDYRAPRPTTYAGEAARTPAPVHYGDRITPTACDLTEETLPFLDGVTLRSSLVTCLRCGEALAVRP
jgi:hypothetical protein